MLGSLGARVASAVMLAERADLSVVSYRVEHPLITSYYTDALALSGFDGWLAEYPRIMPMLHLHAQSKPPGPVVYYHAFIAAMSDSPRTSAFAGVTLGVLATLSVPACYALIRVLGGDADAAVLGAAFFSLCPGFVLFFPMFDPVYAGLVAAMLALWARALERDQWTLSAAGGAVLAVTTFVTFNVLVIGFFMAGVGIVLTWPRVGRLARHAVIVLATCAAAYVVLWFCTGYDPIATFASAWRNQHALVAAHAADRPYPATIWNDLLDFALGAAWIGVVIAAFRIVRAARRRPWDRVTRIVMLGVAQVLVVAVAGLLQSETARVWNFMLPLLAVAVGLELATWSRRMRVGVIVCEIVVMVVVFQNMTFL
jgi:hypothetical protein